jgi:hypothetical protein
MLERMPHDTLLKWFQYLKERPIGWREDDRTFKFLQTQGAKEKPWKYFPSLVPIYQKDADTSLNGLFGSSVFQMMQNAVGGENPFSSLSQVEQ